jgi:short-subunit dehydrogenase
LITGATDGIGELTAMALAKQHIHLLIHGRNEDKLNKVIDEI